MSTESRFLPKIDRQALGKAFNSRNTEEMYDLLVQPLHEELYRRSTFDFLDDLSDGQQLLLAFDYLRGQVGQGGFIQFIENGYIGLLPSLIEQLYTFNLPGMARVLDDVLKVYVLNRELFIKQNTVEEFAKLYEELTEFEEIEQRYEQFRDDTINHMLNYAYKNPEQFMEV